MIQAKYLYIYPGQDYTKQPDGQTDDNVKRPSVLRPEYYIDARRDMLLQGTEIGGGIFGKMCPAAQCRTNGVGIYRRLGAANLNIQPLCRCSCTRAIYISGYV